MKTPGKENKQDAVPPCADVDDVDPESFAMLSKALAHPVRVRIVQYLKKADHCQCGHLVDVFPLAQSTVSQHLKCLRDAGLIQGRIEGPSTCYCLNRKVLARFFAMARTLLQPLGSPVRKTGKKYGTE